MSKGTERSEAQIDFNKRKNYSIYLFCDIYKGKWGGGAHRILMMGLIC